MGLIKLFWWNLLGTLLLLATLLLVALWMNDPSPYMEP